MDPDTARLLTELIEKVGLLRSDLKKKQDFEKYEARFARIDQKFSALAEHLSHSDADLARQLRRAMTNPGVSLAFRNRDHQVEMKRQAADGPPPDEPSE
jgi:hypothetical protein